MHVITSSQTFPIHTTWNRRARPRNIEETPTEKGLTFQSSSAQLHTITLEINLKYRLYWQSVPHIT